MITKDIAVTLTHGTTLYSSLQNNADGTPKRCRVMGKCKTWKRDPERFKLPVKHGLYDSFYIVNDEFARHWHLTQEEAIAFRLQFPTRIISHDSIDYRTMQTWRHNQIVYTGDNPASMENSNNE